MIKNSKKYELLAKKERLQGLRGLTIRQSIRRFEKLISAGRKISLPKERAQPISISQLIHKKASA